MISTALINRIKRKVKSVIGKPFNYLKGRKSINYVLDSKQEDEIIIICTPLIGDTVYSLSCVGALKKKSPSKKIHVFSYRKFIDLLSEYKEIDRVTYIDDSENKILKGLDQFLHFNGLSEHARVKGVISANPFYYKACYNATDPDCLYQMKTHIFDVGEQSEISYHKICKGEERREKVAILNPYSFSTFDASFTIYEMITNELINNGFTVYTNVIKQQKPIKGTHELRCTIEELFELACHSKILISTRSGILDYLAPSDINMFVIYENCSERFRKMYHLTNWNRPSTIKEVYPEIKGYSDKDILKEFKVFIKNINNRG